MKTRRALNRFWVFVYVCCILLAPVVNVGAAFFEKEYLVRHVEGEDILCDPYVVMKNDYVIRLLRQRGDIADKDFPRFLQLFGALNPTVKDIDTIYPNQRILIPLKVLSPDSVEGQSTGTVTIPVITITNLPETIRQHSDEYRVQYGDWVAKLISSRFGSEGSEAYRRGLELFKHLNPDVKDLNKIRQGQILRLPDPAIQNSPVYSSLFDESGELVDAARMPADSIDSWPEPEEEPEVLAEAEPVEKPDPEALPGADEGPGAETDAAEPEGAAGGNEEVPPGKIAVPVPFDLRGFSDPSVFKKAATILDAELLNSGEYFFPRVGQKDLRVILAETPLMIFDGGVKLLFTRGDWLADPDRRVIENHWPGTQIVNYEMKTDLRPLIDVIVPLIDPDGYQKQMKIEDRGITVSVRANYIYDPPGQPGKVCLSLLETPDMRLPDSICAYLKTQGITVRDWIVGDFPSEAASDEFSDWMTFQAPEVLHVASPSAQLFIKLLSDALGYAYQEDIEISFPYAGFQINALTNILSFGPDDEILLDYGDLGGDALDSIRNTGFRIAQIDGFASISTLIPKLSEIMPAEFAADPLFWTAHRPRLYNPSIQVPGWLVSATHGERVEKVLVTDIAMPERIAAHLSDSGIRLMRILQ